ncbi:interleukin-18 receptor accessory protein isoform X3 [Balaenoptera musculus]|uniref:Interleukin-18 receptor accessory protein isoform X3 n=1 Tax=Balaenoptera musculus TaxID=9771 RepID=A0A8B8Z378_BALMU|nr:interleukin-18 receptor accessory protein isoform X3 [Balaenoptera musculus]
MLYLSWIFLWLIAGGKIKGFNTSDCSTGKLLKTYSARCGEEFVLFCDFPEPQKSHFYHRSQLSPTQSSEHLPCSGSRNLSDVQWYLQPQNGDPLVEITRNYPHIIQDKSTLHFLTTEMNNAGSYICRPRIRSPQDEACCVKMILEVKPKTNMSCGSSISHEQLLLLGSMGSIYCPSLSPQSDTQSPEVTWYQNGKLLSEKRSNPIEVDEVYDYHQGTYVCDYTQSDNSSLWTARAVAQVKTIVKNTNLKPDILDPIKDTLEVELGKPLTLNCTARFGFEINFKPVIRWYVKDSDQEWEVPTPEGRSVKSTLKDEVVERVVFLKEVTRSDLRRKFICFAQNSIGNTTQSIQLKEKKGVYAEDIVSIIKKSRRGIFILSPSYVNGPSVFELQAAVNIALEDQTLKLILIKFSSFQEPESLPHLVKKALRVLPTVTWRGFKSVPPNARFWTQIRYHMPVKSSKGFTWNHLRIIPRIFFSRKDSVKQKPLGGTPSLKDGEMGPELPPPTPLPSCPW